MRTKFEVIEIFSGLIRHQKHDCGSFGNHGDGLSKVALCETLVEPRQTNFEIADLECECRVNPVATACQLLCRHALGGGISAAANIIAPKHRCERSRESSIQMPGAIHKNNSSTISTHCRHANSALASVAFTHDSWHARRLPTQETMGPIGPDQHDDTKQALERRIQSQLLGQRLAPCSSTSQGMGWQFTAAVLNPSLMIGEAQ